MVSSILKYPIHYESSIIATQISKLLQGAIHSPLRMHLPSSPNLPPAPEGISHG